MLHGDEIKYSDNRERHDGMAVRSKLRVRERQKTASHPRLRSRLLRRKTTTALSTPSGTAEEAEEGHSWESKRHNTCFHLR